MTLENEETLKNLKAILAKSKPQNKHAFPSTKEHYCKAPSEPQGIFTTDPWPVGFQEQEWKIDQFTKVIKINPFLRWFDYVNPIDWLSILRKAWQMPHALLKRWLSHTSIAIFEAAGTSSTTVPTTIKQPPTFIFYASPRIARPVISNQKELCKVHIHSDFENITLPALQPSSSKFEHHNDLPPSLPSYFSVDLEDDVEEENSLEWKSWILQKVCYR